MIRVEHRMIGEISVSDRKRRPAIEERIRHIHETVHHTIRHGGQKRALAPAEAMPADSLGVGTLASARRRGIPRAAV